MRDLFIAILQRHFQIRLCRFIIRMRSVLVQRYFRSGPVGYFLGGPIDTTSRLPKLRIIRPLPTFEMLALNWPRPWVDNTQNTVLT